MKWTGGRNTKEEQVQQAEDTVKALKLRKLGLTYQEIADRLGLENRQRAHRLVTNALKELPKEPAEELRTLELERLDIATRGLMPKVAKGDDKAVTALMRVMLHRAKLTGLLDVQVDNGQAAAGAKFAELLTTIAAGHSNSDIDSE